VSGLGITPNGATVYVLDGEFASPPTATAISTASNKVARVIKLGGKYDDFIAFAP
jgi:DNA-binding beta-propeller fold protein YncE